MSSTYPLPNNPSSPLDATPLQRSSYMAPVVSIENVAPHHFLLTLNAPVVAASAQAGQFVHILPRVGLGSDPLLRRAFSIMAISGDNIEVLFRVEGRGTTQIAKARPGDLLDILGPLGRPFDLTPFHVKQNVPTPILVGGGVGVPPMVFLAKTFGEMKLKPEVLVGARGSAEVLGESYFNALGLEVAIATDDGSRGHAGRVTDLLLDVLQAHSNTVVYACGPLPMLRAVAKVAERFEAPCQVSMEENMPCGIGVCNGCVVAMRDTSTDYERYRRICIEGPAVWATEIDWENL
jgi:dihydroorotate dehydrogenase electron transfer subunit